MKQIYKTTGIIKILETVSSCPFPSWATLPCKNLNDWRYLWVYTFE